MASIVEFDSAAREEFDQAFDWYAARSSEAARRFVLEVEAALNRIERDPERFASTYAGCQYCSLTKYPYSVVYYHHNNRITVVAVAHAKRRPGYWRLRIT
jgi:plasmid stabilization system protein ParE